MSSDPQRDEDRELESWLEGRHPLGQAYREAAGESAPPDLDAAILRAARETAGATRPIRRRPRWVQPLALAATLVLGVAVLLQLDRQAGDHLPQAIAPPPSGPAPVEAPREMAAAPAPEVADTVPPPPPTPREPETRMRRSVVAAESQASPPPAQPAPVVASKPAPAPDVERKAMASAPGPAYAPKPEMARREALAADLPMASPPRPAAAAPAPQALAGAAASALSDAEQERLPVPEWIERIRARLQIGDEEGVRVLLREFREQHPQADLPADLQAFESSADRDADAR